jgi:hypothetical protein
MKATTMRIVKIKAGYQIRDYGFGAVNAKDFRARGCYRTREIAKARMAEMQARLFHLCSYHADSLTWDACSDDFDGCEVELARQQANLEEMAQEVSRAD